MLTNRVLVVRVIMFQLGETEHKGINLVVAIFVTHDPNFIPTLLHHGNIEFEVHPLDYRLRDRTFPIIVALQTHLIGRRHEKTYVNAMTDAEEIAAVQYGMDLPEPYAAALSEKMAVAQAQMEAIMQKLGGAA